ncbi:MAG: glycoside hydrolase family 3 C-terminal domain-containing protein [Cytophagaceae bacterium]|nr:glycoside hydrolase family 3 C-terminal domain-containing protein [Gemmatimonadaceae bacterium]
MTPEEKFWQLFAIPDDSAMPRALAHGVYGVQVRGHAPQVMARTNALQHYLVDSTRLGIPMIPFEEGLHGVAQPGATVFPQAIAMAATWDTTLVRQVALATAREARRRGIRQVLSPVINIATDVRWGRVEETYGEDPFLTSRMAVAFVRPFEDSGVVTTPKHFVANVGDGGRDSYPIETSERWLTELHFPPFAAAIGEGGARSVMSAYNSVQGAPASASTWLLNDKLRGDLGFRGVVISDAGAVGGANVLHMTAADYPTSGARSIEGGADVIFQSSVSHAALFLPAFLDGRIRAGAIDSAVARVLRLKFALGLFDQPYVTEGAATDTTDRILALDVARAAIVLLATDGRVLPLGAAVRRVALIGPDADSARLGGYSGPGQQVVSIRSALERRLGTARVAWAPGPGRGVPTMQTVPPTAFRGGLEAAFHDNISLADPPVRTRNDRGIDFTWTLGSPDSTLAFGWYSVRWSGILEPPTSGEIALGVDSDDGARLYLDDRLIVDTWRRPSHAPSSATVRVEKGRAYRIRLEYHQNVGPGHVRLVWGSAPPSSPALAIDRAVTAARGASVAVVVAGIEEGEFRDRASLALPGAQDALIRAVAATGTPVVVVIVGGSAVTMPWLDRVAAVLHAWYPGELGGEAVTDVLLGAHNPSGRLPITFPRAEGQLPLTYFHRPTGRGDAYLDLTGRPLFPFGHGLSYSTFTWRDLAIEPEDPGAGDTVRVSLTVRNEGPLRGTEVVQLYLRDEVASIARPVQMLAAFGRVVLDAGAERRVQLVLPPSRFAMLDASLRPVVEPGRFVVMVGASSVDIRLRGVVEVR